MLSNVYRWLERKDEELAFGLAFGLAGVLAGGAAWGLFGGEYGLPLLPVLITWLLLSEAAFIIQARYYETRRYDNFGRVLLKKGEAVLDAALILFTSLNIWWLTNNVRISFDTLLKWIGYIGLGFGLALSLAVVLAGGLALVYAFVKLNQVIANTGKKETVSKKRRMPKKR